MSISNCIAMIPANYLFLSLFVYPFPSIHPAFLSLSLRHRIYHRPQFSSVQWLNHVWIFETSWTAACQASVSITNSQSPPKPMSSKSVKPSNHLILCLSSPSTPALNLSQNQGLIQWVSSSHQLATVLEFQPQNQTFQWIFRVDFP